ncbi:MAG: response regulator [Proteobacteria bacterium]|nr:response regulator [Pseudomonadota bacterium]
MNPNYKPLKINALIIDPRPESRGFLWQAILANSDFHTAKACSDTEDAIFRLTSGLKFDIVLLNSSLSTKRIAEFLPKAKETEGGRESAYVTVLKKKDQSNENVALGIMEGTDGFLLEPFSYDSLKSVAALAAKIKGEHEEKRHLAALNILIKNIIPKIDLYSEMSRKKDNTKYAKDEFLKAYASLERIAENHYDFYIKTVAAEFMKASPRIKKTSSYNGASKRLQMKYS